MVSQTWKKKRTEELSAVACLLTLFVLGDPKLIEENFSPETRKRAAELWQKLEDEGFTDPKSKYNRLLDLLLEYSTDLELTESAKRFIQTHYQEEE